MSIQNTSADAALLSFLVRWGVVSNEVTQAAQEAAAISGQETSVIEWLVRNNVIGEEELAQTLGGRLRLPYVNLATVALDPHITSLVREELAMRYQLVPLRLSDDRLVVATANPVDREALRAVEFATRKRVQPAVATLTGIRDALHRTYQLDQALNEYLRGVPDDSEVPIAELMEDSTDVKSLLRGTTLPPVIKLSNLIVVEGLRNGASDIHIEAGVSDVLVRYRVDGILEESFRLPKWVQDALIARCKVLSKLDITERRVPQDGRIRISYRDRLVDLRVSSLPTQFGEKLTMRVLDPTAAPRGLEGFGLAPRDLQLIRQAIARPEGMVLVTGPTGSGKTTSLYGMIAEIISPTRNIVTIENPIEYQLRGVNQVEINEKQGLTFAGTLRSILRQDPDVILVGEIRDGETAEIALRAAQTGHLVLSTLHTNDSVSTITRLVDLGIEPYMLSSSLHLVMAQRLVRRTCEQCAEPAELSPEALHMLRLAPNGGQFKRGRGCGACRKSGYAGRMAVFEVMPITRRLATLIEARAVEGEIRAAAVKEGMRALHQDAATKVMAGLTTAEEVLRVVDVPEDSRQCPSCQRPVEESFVRCPHCAASLQTSCESCGMRLQREWRVCPYCGNDSAGKPKAPPAAITPVSESRRFHTLIVDDEPDFQRLLTLTLERSGLPVTVETASSGIEALARIEQRPPDLLILDVMMPEVDGFEVCRQLRGNVRTAFIPILTLTALNDPRNRARGFFAGTDDYVGKPFDRLELVARVRRILERTYGGLSSHAASEPSDWEQTVN